MARLVSSWAALCAFGLLALGAAEAAEFDVYPESGLAYTVLRQGQVYLRLDVTAWGPSWSWFGFGGPDGEQDGRHVFSSTATIGGTANSISMAHAARAAGSEGVALDYALTAPRQTALTQIVVTLRPAEGPFAGGKCAAVGPGSEVRGLALPFVRGTVGELVAQLILTDAEGRHTVIGIEPARPVSMDAEGRIALVGDSIGEGETRATRITVALPGETAFYPSREQTVQHDDAPYWFPYPVGPQGFPLDLSFLNRDADGNYVPAGAHGFLTVRDGDFAFEDGTPARFWGLNVTAGAALGSPERAEQVAERLARLGCNIVRLHHLDSWANPIIDYDNPDGTTQHLSAAGMRALDRTIYELKRHGIYVILDPWVQRCFREGDGVADYGGLGRRDNFGLHPYIYFDERMQELLRQTWEQVWTHVNEFTGVAYKDEPAIVMTEVINEGLLTGLDGVTQPFYRQEVGALYEQWAAANGGLPLADARIFEQNWGENNERFFTWLHRRFYEGAHGFFRSIGLRIPINATNWGHFTWVMAAQTGLDFMDSHHYFGGDRVGPGSGLAGLWLSNPPETPDGPFGVIGGFAVVGKPVATSESGNNPPKTYRAAYQLGLAAVAAFQGWDSIAGYAYSQSGNPRDALDPYEWETDPATLASVALGALVFRRGDVSPARQAVLVELPKDEVWTLRWENNGAMQYWNTAAFNVALESHRVLVATPDAPAAGIAADWTLRPADLFAYRHPTTEVRSDTGELWRDWALGVGLVDTPRTQAAYGRLGESGRPWQTADCTFEVETPFAVVALSSLDGLPIAESGRLLLAAVARAQNTGMTYNLAGDSIVDQGRAPVICEPVVGTVRVRTNHAALLVRPIAVENPRDQSLEIPVRDGTAVLELRPGYRTILYEIVAADPRAGDAPQFRRLGSPAP